MPNLYEFATEWRTQNGYEGKGGVVVMFDGEVQGWVNELRDPEHWQPGCIAITEDGHISKAVDGNEYHGAKRWEPINQHWKQIRRFIMDKERVVTNKSYRQEQIAYGEVGMFILVNISILGLLYLVLFVDFVFDKDAIIKHSILIIFSLLCIRMMASMSLFSMLKTGISMYKNGFNHIRSRFVTL